MMTRDYELIDSIEMLEKAIQRMDIAENGTPYILDWSHATKGNASADVARTYLLFSLAGDVSGANTYLDLFCKKRHCKTLCSEVDADCSSITICKRQ